MRRLMDRGGWAVAAGLLAVLLSACGGTSQGLPGADAFPDQQGPASSEELEMGEEDSFSAQSCTLTPAGGGSLTVVLEDLAFTMDHRAVATITVRNNLSRAVAVSASTGADALAVQGSFDGSPAEAKAGSLLGRTIEAGASAQGMVVFSLPSAAGSGRLLLSLSWDGETVDGQLGL